MADDEYAEKLKDMTVAQIRELVDSATEEELSFMMDGAEMNENLSDYGLDGSSIPALLKKLEEHGMTQLGENHDITLDVSRRIYEAAR